MQRVLAVMVVVVTLLSWPVAARAEDPTPIPPTATPSYQYEVSLASGGTLLVQRVVSYGDVAVVVAALAILLVALGYMFVRIPKLWRS